MTTEEKLNELIELIKYIIQVDDGIKVNHAIDCFFSFFESCAGIPSNIAKTFSSCPEANLETSAL